MTQALLQGEFPHPSFPHLGGMGVPESMGSDPWLTHVQPLAMTLKHLDECMVAQWLASSQAASSNQKDQGALRLGRTLLHDVGTQGLERFWLVQIHHPFRPRFGPDPLGMIRAMTDHDAASTVLNILQVQVQHFYVSSDDLIPFSELRLSELTLIICGCIGA